MVQMFGVMPNNPDSWLQEKGQEVGREVMGKLMQAVYQADGMEAPADAIGKLLPPLCVCISRIYGCLLYTSPSPRDRQKSRMPSSA